jgi:hypothetical protein
LEAINEEEGFMPRSNTLPMAVEEQKMVAKPTVSNLEMFGKM